MTDETIPEVTASVCVGGQELDTDAFTSLVCVQPTKIWRQKHERIKITHPYLNTIEWIYERSKQRKWNLGEAIDEVLSVFWGKRMRLSNSLRRMVCPCMLNAALLVTHL